MRFLVAVMTGAALALIAVSAMMNWVFMSSLGKSDFDRQILGAVSVAISVFIAVLPTFMVWAYREKRYLYTALAVPVFLAFATFSMSSAVGFSAKNHSVATD